MSSPASRALSDLFSLFLRISGRERAPGCEASHTKLASLDNYRVCKLRTLRNVPASCTMYQSVTYRYRELFIFWWYRNRYRNKLVPEKNLGTGIGKIWYWEKVSEPVSEKFGTEKRYRYRYRKYLVPEKSIGIGIVQHFGYRHTLPTAPAAFPSPPSLIVS